jgi:hypothetical protein
VSKTVVFAAASTVVGGSGQRVQLREGDVWWADALEVQRHPDLFSDLPPAHMIRGSRPNAPVEQATAAPGERRGIRRPQ